MVEFLQFNTTSIPFWLLGVIWNCILEYRVLKRCQRLCNVGNVWSWYVCKRQESCHLSTQEEENSSLSGLKKITLQSWLPWQRWIEAGETNSFCYVPTERLNFRAMYFEGKHKLCATECPTPFLWKHLTSVYLQSGWNFYGKTIIYTWTLTVNLESSQINWKWIEYIYLYYWLYNSQSGESVRYFHNMLKFMQRIFRET